MDFSSGSHFDSTIGESMPMAGTFGQQHDEFDIPYCSSFATRDEPTLAYSNKEPTTSLFTAPAPPSSSPSPSSLRKRSLSSGPKRPSVEQVSLAEYERQSKEFTRQQLKNSGLYSKHRMHFARMRAKEILGELWRLGRRMVFPALVISTVLLTLLGVLLIFSEPGIRSTGGVYMLPPSIPEPRTRNGDANASAPDNATAVPNEQGVLGGMPRLVLDYVVSTAGEVLPALKQDTGKKSGEEANNNKGSSTNAAAPVATYDSTSSVTSYIRNQTEKGMNIFSFAYTVAYEFAFSAITRALGWSGDVATNGSSSSSPSDSRASMSRGSR